MPSEDVRDVLTRGHIFLNCRWTRCPYRRVRTLCYRLFLPTPSPSLVPLPPLHSRGPSLLICSLTLPRPPPLQPDGGVLHRDSGSRRVRPPGRCHQGRRRARSASSHVPGFRITVPGLSGPASKGRQLPTSGPPAARYRGKCSRLVRNCGQNTFLFVRATKMSRSWSEEIGGIDDMSSISGAAV